MTPAARSRGYLPHLEGDNPIYFVTFRLADSLPRELLDRLRKERHQLEKANRADAAGVADRDRLRKLRAIIRQAERCLDAGLGECYLRDARIAKIVADAVRHFQGERYRLFA